MSFASKKGRLSEEKILAIAKEASEVEMPWENISPDYFVEWLNKFACAHNVVKEMMFMAILPSIAALLGSRSFVKPSENEPYCENFSFFSLSISPPSSGKSQAHKYGAKVPLSYVEKSNEGVLLLLDKFTDAGLRQHLLQQKGTAAIVKDEMYDTLKAIVSEKEMGTLCRLYDGDTISSSSGNNATRITTQETCVSLGGFIQVKDFLSDIYPMMAASQNGFEQRFLYAIIKPKAMTRRESQPYVHMLQESNLKDLTEIYDAVYRDHKEGVTYTFSPEALALYDEYDQEICKMMNSKWELGVLIKDDAEVGKDRKQVIRLAGILYVLYTYTRRALFQSYGTVSHVIGKRYVEYAITLMKEYFRKQKRIIDNVLDLSAVGSTATGADIEKKILEHAGPVVHLRTLRCKYNSNRRPPKEEIIAAMKLLSDEGIGNLVTKGTTSAFVKKVPSNLEEADLAPFGVSMREYDRCFCRKNYDLPQKNRDSFLDGDVKEEIDKYIEEHK